MPRCPLHWRLRAIHRWMDRIDAMKLRHKLWYRFYQEFEARWCVVRLHTCICNNTVLERVYLRRLLRRTKRALYEGERALPAN